MLRGAPKNFCNKDFAELSVELSGKICLKTLVLLSSALEFRCAAKGGTQKGRGHFFRFRSLFGSLFVTFL